MRDAARGNAPRSVVRWRRRAGWLLLAAPAIIVVLLDVVRRGDRLAAFEGWHHATYAAAVAESLVVWGVLLLAASRRRGAGRWLAASLFVVAVTFSFGGQQYFFEQSNVYLTVDVSTYATSFTESVVNQLLADVGNYFAATLPFLAAALGLVWLARTFVRPRRRQARWATVLAPVALVAAMFIPTQYRQAQASTPDVLYLNGIGGLVGSQLGITANSKKLRPGVRHSLPVPPIASRPPVDRNVLFIILESVRADATCVDPEADCRRTGATHRLLPGRHPLTQMRALDSTTGISVAVLWSGLGAHESREVFHTWPLVFDYARAVGWDTAYWTSQHMMFGNARLWVENLGVRSMFTATDVDPMCNIDLGADEAILAERVIDAMNDLREPFLAVLHLSNAHYPYRVDSRLPQPFQPASTSKDPEDKRELFNHYQNAVHQQDLHLASILRHLRSTPAGERTVVLYTSDHAEAFREHGGTGHTFSVLDEEIKVPGWIDAPPGTLTDEERGHLAASRDAFTFHPDLTATVMDLMGVWTDPAVVPFKKRMLGRSLLRERGADRATPLTNCSGVWTCAYENWGYMRGSLKLQARSWDREWSCFDVARDPRERRDLGVQACRELRNAALATFGRLPGRPRE